MKLKEAYSILELEPSASSEEAKKKYRELTKKFHPDINKAPDAEAKFKKINEAYQVVQNGEAEDQFTGDHFSPFTQNYIHIENINVQTTISFKESVLGTKKEIKYTRNSKCNKCQGAGEIKLNNGCKKCGGKGQVVTQHSGSIMVSTCTSCFGKSKSEDCDVCNTEGSVKSDVSVSVSIPGGILNGTVLRLHGMGHYVGTFMGWSDNFSDVHCHVTVTPENGLSIEGKDVVSHKTIHLIDAIKGCKLVAHTILGDKEIVVNPLSKNKEEIIIPNCGVNGIGAQRVILNVEYPKNTDKLINFLESDL